MGFGEVGSVNVYTHLQPWTRSSRYMVMHPICLALSLALHTWQENTVWRLLLSTRGVSQAACINSKELIIKIVTVLWLSWLCFGILKLTMAGVHTTEINKHCESAPLHLESWLLNIYQHTTSLHSWPSWDETYPEEKVKVQVREPWVQNRVAQTRQLPRNSDGRNQCWLQSLRQLGKVAESKQHYCSWQTESQSSNPNSFTYFCVTWENHGVLLVSIRAVNMGLILVMGRHRARCFPLMNLILSVTICKMSPTWKGCPEMVIHLQSMAW